MREKIDIEATPERVWGIMSDLQGMGKWNPAVKEITPITGGRVRAGMIYQTVAELNGKPMNARLRVEECVAPKRLKLVYEGEDEKPRWRSEEHTSELQPR